MPIFKIEKTLKSSFIITVLHSHSLVHQTRTYELDKGENTIAKLLTNIIVINTQVPNPYKE